MDRGRDRRFNDDDRHLGREDYRLSDRDAPPRPEYRSYRSPPRRGRTPPPRNDGYNTMRERRRSRSPAYGAGRGVAGYRERPRSPPRGYSPRRDVRPRSPLPRARRYSRSPVPVRREPSPYRRPRSPPPVKRERVASPPRDRYDRRGYSPPRSSRPAHPDENSYRARVRSPSPVRRTQHVSRKASPISSRRSSPPIHPDRLAKAASDARSPAYRDTRVPPHARDSNYREPTPPARVYTPQPLSPRRDRESTTYRQRSPLPREQDDYRNGTTPAAWSDAQLAPAQSSVYRNGDARAPPSGPAYREMHARDPPSVAPSGPVPAAPISMSAHNRPTSASLLSAPTRPRGGSSFAERGSRDHPQGGAPYRGARPPPASPYRGATRGQNYDSRPPPPEHNSYGSRSSHQGASAPYEPPYRAPPPFRSNNSSSTTYPRTQRFHHLASVPTIKEGGEALPSLMDPAARKRLAELEENKKKLMEQIEEKQKEKRKGLREWESRERESRRDELRSELAESSLEAMSGEGIERGTAF